ncbi:NAD(P)H-hydrate dehydratase [Streptococcus catagoni]|uniref:NAD(P)H-hydrate dehydratase n=1 Tax=Streptococcus catagoni TaxID=2654874 RepID=UPI001407ADE2|nr:NAD(P)H-hydrate dehydratase [Streptococcus catagoni]
MIIDERDLKKVIIPRPKESHKGDFGRLLLIGGLYPFGGAILLSALACVNSGAGLVTVATDKDNISALHSRLPEAMAFDVDDRALLEENIEKSDLVLIGPGLNETDRSEEIFDFLIDQIDPKKLLLIDGSALRILAKKGPSLLSKKRALILTPHQKEWENLSRLTIEQQTLDNNQAILKEQFSEQTILVAKSHQTSILQGDFVYQLQKGGPYQSTGGMGDTLAGMIAAFAVQFPKSSLLDRVAAAVCLHSLIADELSADHYVVLPSTISEEIPKWMQKFSQK